MKISRKRLPLILVFLFSLLLVAIILIYDHAYLSSLDIRVLRFFNRNRIKSLDGVFQFLTDINTTVSITTISLVAVLSYMKRSKIIFFKACGIASALITTTLLTNAIKELIDRERPYDTYSFIERLTVVVTPSFPSGHTSEAFALAAIVSLFFRNTWIIVAFFTWAILIGYSRMLLGVHYPTDVIAAIILGCNMSLLIWIIFAPRTRQIRLSE